MDILIKFLLAFTLIIVGGCLGGVVVWLTWDVFTIAFPFLLDYGVPKELSLWNSVKLSWLFAALIKSSSTSSS